ncbi:MAG: bifunctional acetate--CoA ligase family protein/GNAT family N-acetyltransferase, partial [Vicinamibacterales bacterium]
AIFSPRNVAVIGATDKPDSVGRTILWNLISSPFGGAVFPVNPQRQHVLGIKAYPSIAAVPDAIDLAIIVTPAPTVPGIIRECVDAGVKGAIIISAGFKETGDTGAALEHRIVEEARRGNMRIVGPNCLGVMSPVTGLNATFAAGMARPGNVGFISQSGALCTAVLDWSYRENVGFSHFVSIGSMLDVGWGDLIDFLGQDGHTRSIVIYMESVGDARAFLSAAREVALTKPIIIIKAGRTGAAAQAAASHTGALAGSDLVLDAAFRRSGVLRVDSIAELFYMADVLAKQPRPAGPRLTILTNAGGPGVLATDALIGNQGELATLAPATVEALDRLLPRHWSHGNPVDILGDAGADRYAEAVRIASADEHSDGLLVVLSPQAMTDPTRTAEALKTELSHCRKPIIASWMGGPTVAAGQAILARANIPNFPYPDTAARIFTHMWRYSYNLRSIYETPAIAPTVSHDTERRARAAALLTAVRSDGRTLLTEVESKQVLAAYSIPTIETRLAATADEAVAAAEAIGYPVVLKLHSTTITHKTDVGGVVLGITSAAAVRRAFDAIATSVTAKAGAAHFLGVTVQPMISRYGHELIVGSSIDPQFGPVLLFGWGGQLVEVYRDRALALPPLNSTLALRMMEQTKVFRALQGVRGSQPVDLGALEQLLVRFSEMVVEQRWIKEIDINPLLASPEGLLALDARIVVHDASIAEADLPPLAIRPYPVQYVGAWTLKNGTPVTIRPIRPEDEPLIVQFHQALSGRSVYYRYLHMIGLSERIAHERLTRVCFIDYSREMALVAERQEPDGTSTILGVGRLMKLHGSREAEFALLIADAYQGQGLGPELLRRLVQVGRDEKLARIVASIDLENREMRVVSERVGFTVAYDREEGLMHAHLAL